MTGREGTWGLRGGCWVTRCRRRWPAGRLLCGREDIDETCWEALGDPMPPTLACREALVWVWGMRESCWEGIGMLDRLVSISPAAYSRFPFYPNRRCCSDGKLDRTRTMYSRRTVA